MGFFYLLLLLVVAAIVGGLGARLAGQDNLGCLGSIAVGFIGALIGSYLSRLMAIPDLIYLPTRRGPDFPLIWSIVGAALFVALLGLLRRR